MADNPLIDRLLDVIIEEGVKVASYGKGDPQKIIARTKPHGIINMPTMGALRHAIRAEQDGADAVIVQGNEAGGAYGICGNIGAPADCSREIENSGGCCRWYR